MIRILLGNPGSGKTCLLVREMILNPSSRVTYSNIKTKGVDDNIIIDESMIITKEIHIGPRGKETIKLNLNQDFWKKQIDKKGAINLVIDEAHTILNPRRAMSKKNIIMGDFLSLIRRIIGQASDGYGELVLISQLERRLDPIAKDMATKVQFSVCHYLKSCNKCGCTWQENNEMPETIWSCPTCGHKKIIKHTHVIELWSFKSMRSYEAWRDMGAKTYYAREIVEGLDDFFQFYNTLQWDNLISDY